MVAAGFVFAAYSEYRMVYWTPGISVADFISTGFIQGMGVIMITVPIATIAFLTLPIELRTEATSVFSLLRNLGSAIGISVTSALLEVSTQVNHADISSAVTPFNRALAGGAPLQYWNPLRPEGVAALDSVINRQGIIIAYSNDFKLLFLLTALTLPLVLLIRTPAKQA
jgi:DHA2 family multidrug resistance protein